MVNVILAAVLSCAVVYVNGYILYDVLDPMGSEQNCLPTEYYSECGESGEPTCSNPDPDTCYGPPTCICRRDLVRDNRSGLCIRQDKCYVGPHPYPLPDYIPPFIPEDD